MIDHNEFMQLLNEAILMESLGLDGVEYLLNQEN